MLFRTGFRDYGLGFRVYSPIYYSCIRVSFSHPPSVAPLQPEQNTTGYATTDIPPASTLANFYSIYDADGSLLGHHRKGFALASYQPLLPPATVQADICKEREQWGPMWGCEGVCYRSPVLVFNESTPSEPVDGLPYRWVDGRLKRRWWLCAQS